MERLFDELALHPGGGSLINPLAEHRLVRLVRVGAPSWECHDTNRI
jgi:hypothetical protein